MSSEASSSSCCVVLHAAKDVRIEERTPQPPKAGEAQIAVKATGLCGSDSTKSHILLRHELTPSPSQCEILELASSVHGAHANRTSNRHYYLHGGIAGFPLQHSMVLGHEGAGVITAVGEGVEGLKVGDKVAIEVGINCQKCRYCKGGNYNLCTSMRFSSSSRVVPHQDGTMQRVMNHPARCLHKMPDSCSYEEGALCEPLSVALQAVRRASVALGQRTLVFGAGSVGLLTCALLQAAGATQITVVDIQQDRIDFAVKEGFAHSGHLLPRGAKPDTPDEGVEASKKTAQEILAKYLPGSDGFDRVFDCTGVLPCMQMTIFATRPGGKAVFVGMGAANAYLPISFAFAREVDLVGVFRYANTYPEAIELFSGGKLPNVHKLVTHRFPLKDAVKALDTLVKGNDENGGMVIKLMVGDY